MSDAPIVLAFMFPVLVVVVGLAVLGFINGVQHAPREIHAVVAVAVVCVLTLQNLMRFTSVERGGDLGYQGLWLSSAFVVAAVVGIYGAGHACGAALSHWRRSRGRAALLLPIYLLVPLVLWGRHEIEVLVSHRRDAAMIEHFSRNEREFMQLAEMFQEDRDLLWLCADGRDVWPNERTKPTPERFQRYTALFESTGVKFGLSRRFLADGQIWFRYWAVRGMGNLEKGYAIVPSPPKPLVDSLDEPQQPTAYRHLSGNWYLYYHDGDSILGPCI